MTILNYHLKYSFLDFMTKTFYYLIKVEDDDENVTASDFKIVTSKKGEQLPCGKCTPEKKPHMEMLDFRDTEERNVFPYIAF